MPSFHDLTTVQLKQAVQIREQIESLQLKLNTLLGGTAAAKQTKTVRPAGKRTMSAAARARIGAAQKARWAKTKGTAATKSAPKSSATPAKSAPKRKSFSPERRAKLAAAMKARWAAKKKADASAA